MQQKIRTIIGVSAVCLVAVSCKKKSNPPLFVGKWKEIQYAIDANGNGIMDANEVMADSSITNMTFNSNGTGSIADFTGYFSTYTWSAESNNWLKIKQATISYYMHVDNVTASTLTLKDSLSVGHMAEWTIFVKQ